MASTSETTPLKQALADSERSYAWLARKVDVNRVSVLRWAEGIHEPDDETKAKVAAVLGRNVTDLWPTDESGLADAA